MSVRRSHREVLLAPAATRARPVVPNHPAPCTTQGRCGNCVENHGIASEEDAGKPPERTSLAATPSKAAPARFSTSSPTEILQGSGVAQMHSEKRREAVSVVRQRAQQEKSTASLQTKQGRRFLVDLVGDPRDGTSRHQPTSCSEVASAEALDKSSLGLDRSLDGFEDLDLDRCLCLLSLVARAGGDLLCLSKA